MKISTRKPYRQAHLRQMQREGNVAGLLEALKAPRVQKSARLRSALVIRLRELGDPQAVPFVGELLVADRSELVRRTAAHSLGGCRDPRAVPALCEALDDESERVQMWAIRSLGQIGDQASVDRLLEKLGDPDWGIRGFAADALGEIGDRRAVEHLTQRLKDDSSTVRKAAEGALARIESAGISSP
jgi:bilin biosynthesis protein